MFAATLPHVRVGGGGDEVSALPSSFDVGDDYGEDAARAIAQILQLLYARGFVKAAVRDYSAFDRILGGLTWLVQRIVKREDAARGRVQWDLLFQPHNKMKPRLLLAQEVVRCVGVLAEQYHASAMAILQPHQLLLQDFGDIGAVRRLTLWLLELDEDASHLAAIRSTREHVGQEDESVRPLPPPPPPLQREVVYVQTAFAPRRRWQYRTTGDGQDESEDAAIQRCLLEYGERVTVVAPPATAVETVVPSHDKLEMDPRKALLAQLAGRSSASGSALVASDKTSLPRPRKAAKDAFDVQYARAMQQALAEEAARLETQRAREASLLEQVVSVPESSDSVEPEPAHDHTARHSSYEEVEHHETLLRQLETQHRTIEAQRRDAEQYADALDAALVDLQHEKTRLDAEERANGAMQPQLVTLRALVDRNEALKRQRAELKATLRSESDALRARVEQLRQQAMEEAAHQDEETHRLREIEQMHTQMAGKHRDLQLALGRQTRELHRARKQIDDVPTRIELVQYEKRFLELYDQVALTLEETRKYYSVYNTLKTTLAFLDKEIALLNSIHANFETAMASKPATQAFFTQLDGIITNVQSSVRRQRTQRETHQRHMETLDSKYQLLLEKERTYVNAIREFQRECDKHDKLSTRLETVRRQMQDKTRVLPLPMTPDAVGPDDVVI